jgi:hypothetical protein
MRLSFGAPKAQAVNAVTVLFKDTALLFALPPGATLGDLASRIAAIPQRRFGSPVSIDLRIR